MASWFSLDVGYSLIAIAVSFLMGFTTSGVEVISRYRDEPFQTVWRFGRIYVLVNAGLGVVAYWVLYESTVEVSTLGAHLRCALLGGLGAAAILRVRVSSVKIGDEEVAIGPGYVVDQLLSVLDRQIDRSRALERVRVVHKLMGDLDFQKTSAYASNMVLESAQNLSLQEQLNLGHKISEINNVLKSEQDKAYSLGFVILNYMGEDFLEEILSETQRERLKASAAEPQIESDNATLVRSRLASVPFEEARRHLEENLAELAAAASPALSAEECEDLRGYIGEIAAEDAPDADKSRDLGHLVIEVFDRDTLKRLYPLPPL